MPTSYYEYPAYTYGPINYPSASYDIMNYGRSYIPAVGESEPYYDSEEESQAYVEPWSNEEPEQHESSTTKRHHIHYDGKISKDKTHAGRLHSGRHLERRDEVEDARKEILNYYSQFTSSVKKDQMSYVHSDKYKKVQVQQEETGVPRVQVNAGYENPKIQCEGSEMCSGVLLKWVITFYGSYVP